MLSRDTQVIVKQQDGFGRAMCVGDLADKVAEAARLGEEFSPEIVVFDPAQDTMTFAAVEVSLSKVQQPVVSLGNHINTNTLTCVRDMEVFVADRGFIKASDVHIGDRSRQPAVRYDKRDTTIASKVLILKYPTSNMEVVDVHIKGDVRSFFAGSMLVRAPHKNAE